MIRHPWIKIRHIARSLTKIDHLNQVDAFYEFIVACKRHYQLPLEIILHARNGFENICILQKQA